MRTAIISLICLLAGAALAWMVRPQPTSTSPQGTAEAGRAAQSPSSGTARADSRPIPLSERLNIAKLAATRSGQWNALEALTDLGLEERHQARLELLREWYAEDPAAALRAAIDTMATEQFFTGKSLLSAFDEGIANDPETFFNLVQGESFGLMTGTARLHWIQVVSQSQPGALIAFLPQLGAFDTDMVAKKLLGPDHVNHPDRQAWISDLASLPDTPENKRVFEQLGAEFADQSFIDLINGAKASEGGLAKIYESAIIARFKSSNSRDQVFDQLQLVPPSMRSEVVDGAIKQIDNNPLAFTALIDSVIQAGDWDRYHKELPYRLHNQLAHAKDPIALATWATTIPAQQRYDDIYRVGIRTYINRSPDEALEWIGDLPPGWHRDNSLSEFSLSSLHARNNEKAALDAIDRIQDPRIQKNARSNHTRWQNR